MRPLFLSITRHVRLLWFFTVSLTICVTTPCVRADSSASPASLGVGATFPVLQVGAATYHDVRVRSVTVRSIVILHRDGLGSIPLHDLSPELQKAFGYSPEAEASADAKISAPVVSAPKAPVAKHRQISKFDTLLRQFSQPPEIQPEVDLRPRFIDLGLYAKNQGRRPSCAVFAVVSALEFQNADLLGHPEKLSEEYLIWATRKILGRDHPYSPATSAETEQPAPSGDEDEGFALVEVVTALRTYGIPLEDHMPDTLGRKMQDITEPAPTLIDEARRHCHVAVYPVPQATLIGNCIQALNAGIPVVIGIKWPHYASIRAGYLSQQIPMSGYGHAVTLVGYHCPTQSLEDTVFIFKNSWGVQWGAAGFGQVTSAYLKSNLTDAVILEVQRTSD
ncbi:MAG TPA: C1 family peptidase [Rariglobus sp.]|nr:C1 family peptidase [Rariglobus sp.]